MIQSFCILYKHFVENKILNDTMQANDEANVPHPPDEQTLVLIGRF